MLTGPLVAAALLLAVSGTVKVTDPLPVRQTLRDLGLPDAQSVARALGAVEVVVAVAAVARPEPLAAGLAVLYAAFAATIVYVLARRRPVASCGCAGRRQVPPTSLHVVLNLTAAGVGGLAAFGLAEGIVPAVRELGALAVPFAIGVASVAYVSFAAVVYGPAVLGGRARLVHQSDSRGVAGEYGTT